MTRSAAPASHVTSPTQRDIDALLGRHGFTPDQDTRVWWDRVHPADFRVQAIRFVIWGVPNKPNPRIGGEIVTHLNERFIIERQRATQDGQVPADMDLWQVSLLQPWPDVVAEFDRTVMPRFDA